ncbi:unnamed protein product [Rhizopus stolonifer]
MAIMSLWYLQAYLSDHSIHQNESYEICKRVLNKCQSIVFSDDTEPPTLPTSKVKENVFPAIVGLGAMLAGFGQPLMTRQAGQIAIAQGRRNLHPELSHIRRNTTDETRPPQDLPKRSTASESHLLRPKHLYSPSLEDLHRGKAFSVTRYLKTAQKKMNQKINPTEKPPESLSVFDPKLSALGQSSVPTHTPHANNSSSEKVLAHSEDRKLSIRNQRNLLRSNYFRSEIQFVLTLVDIATRLVIVPREARMSALHAELTLLNHNLPAEICLPLWCPATSHKPYHHRVVRISPSDAVVLNSAERAPYLLMIEVLDDELSFDEDGCEAIVHRKPQFLKNSEPPVVIKQNELTKELSADISEYHVKRDVKSRRNSKSADNYAERMRTAAVLLAQLQQGVNTIQTNQRHKQGTEQIRQKVIREMTALEEQRMKKMKTEGVGSGIGGGEGEGAESDLLEDEQHVAWVVNKEDPSAAVLSENWEVKKERLRKTSPYGHLPNWRLLSVIVKHGSDLRQEQFAIQLIREMQRIWEDTGVDVWVKYFRVLVTSDGSGLIETLKNTISIHSIKKEAYTRGWNEKGTVFTLYNYFEKMWGPPGSEEFIKAQDAFMRSLAGYSIACYMLQIKDRHNGNLLIDNYGHLIHIDFGFMLSNSPGSVGFEMAPFKLPQEYIDILGGVHSEKFAEYKALMKAAFVAIRKHSENILLLTEMVCKDSNLPCFQNGELTVSQLRDRFQLQLPEPQAEELVDKLIMSSCCNMFTRLYDTFQYYSQGIL